MIRTCVVMTAALMACGGGERPAAQEVTEEESAGPGLTARVSGEVEATVEGAGDLTCIDMGDFGPGYLNIRDRRSPEKIVLRTPIGAEPGTHQLTSGASMRDWGTVYIGMLNLPTKGVITSDATEGTVTLDTFDPEPGGRVAGSFDFSTTAGARVQGEFDFVVPDDARESC